MSLFPETVSNPRYRDYYFSQGDRTERLLYLELDGQDVVIHSEQRLLDRYGVVVFFPTPGAADNESEMRYKAILPAEPWRPPSEVPGATSDLRVVRATRRYLNDLATDAWRPGPVADL